MQVLWAINHTLDPGVMNKRGVRITRKGESGMHSLASRTSGISVHSTGNSVGFHMKRHEGLVVKLYAKQPRWTYLPWSSSGKHWGRGEGGDNGEGSKLLPLGTISIPSNKHSLVCCEN